MKGLLKIITANTSAAELIIYGDIGDLGYEGTVKAKDIISELSAIKAKSLLVRINSYGGRVDEGLAIYNAIRAYPGAVTTRVEGVAASIASVIAMAGSRVEVARGAMLMMHPASSFAGGNSKDHESAAESLRKTDQSLAEIYARRSGREVSDELELLVQSGDRWLTAEKAVAEGYADAIYDPDEQTAQAAEPALCDGLLHHLPTAGAFAGVITARLAHHRKPPAAKAAADTPETIMPWITLARALGIKLAKEADDAAARAAIAQHFDLADDATDDQLAAAVSAVGEALENQDAPAAGGAGAAQTAAAAAPVQTRRQEITALFDIAMDGRQDTQALRSMRAQALIGNDSIDAVRDRLVNHLGNGAEPVQGHTAGSVEITADARDKSRDAATGWLLARAGLIKAGTEEHRKVVQGNPFARMNFHDIARECLEDAGVNVRRMNRMDVIINAITHSTSDFPNIFENALHKTLLRGFELQRPTWDRFCKTGSLSDFRPHIRYRAGSVGDLEIKGENGEYKSMTLSDAERESITAQSRGGILNVTREMLVNDDMSVFTDIAMMLGASSARTLDKAVFALFAMNSGNGPTMGDGKALFHSDHKNISGAAGAPTVTAVEADRVTMASQTDASGNDYLDLRPEIWLGPLSKGGAARVVNESTYDPDAASKLQRKNIVANLYNDIVDTPRLSGDAWYSLANPNIEPVFEVGFLDGQSTPMIEQKEAWSQAGMSWRVLYEFGVAAVGFRGIVKNAGS